MTTGRHLAVRAAAIYLPIVLLAIVCLIKRPDRRAVTGAFMSMAWNVPALLAIHLLADPAGWWHFDAEGGMLMRLPVDLWLGWALLWGPLPALVFRSAPLAIVVAAGLAVDLVVMPAGFPVVRLGDNWLIGEAVALAVCLIPAQLLARWTATDCRLRDRTLLQVIAFCGLLVLVIPAVAIDASRTSWVNPLTYPRWALGFIIQVLALPALLGLSAVQEFVTRGLGTPVPFDPPRRIVTTGPYAYVSNPMQVSAVLLLLMLGAIIQNPWVAAAGVMGHIYSAGLAGWDENADLNARFGAAWVAYRRSLRSWLPRWRPWYRDEDPIATLYVSEDCDMCREVSAWFRSRGVRGLSIVAAEDHPRETLNRIRYESTDATYRASGIAAVARALEHVHLGWALLAFAIRLPIVSLFMQLLIDASGAGPRTVRRRAAGAGCQN